MNLFKGYWTYGTIVISVICGLYAWFQGWIDDGKFLMILAGASTAFGIRRAIAK